MRRIPYNVHKSFKTRVDILVRNCGGGSANSINNNNVGCEIYIYIPL